MTKAMKYGNNPSLASLLELHKHDILASMNCHQVGEIVSFNPATQTAEVQVKMQRMHNGEIKNYPLLIDCPCVVLFGGKGRVTFPISQGDSCLVLFNDRDIDNWYSGGQTMPPRTERKHSFSDAIAIVGVHNKQNQISDYLSNGTELKYGDSVITLKDSSVVITNGTAKVTLEGGTITITGSSMSVDVPVVTFSGAATFAGTVTAAGLTVGGKDVGPSHTHSGVQTGTGRTGGVV